MPSTYVPYTPASPRISPEQREPSVTPKQTKYFIHFQVTNCDAETAQITQIRIQTLLEEGAPRQSIQLRAGRAEDTASRSRPGRENRIPPGLPSIPRPTLRSACPGKIFGAGRARDLTSAASLGPVGSCPAPSSKGSWEAGKRRGEEELLCATLSRPELGAPIAAHTARS